MDQCITLRYDQVILNIIPGMLEFDPLNSNVMKWNDMVDLLAGDIITFVNDLGASVLDMIERILIGQVTSQTILRLQYLGIQDASSKDHPSLQIRRSVAWVRNHQRGILQNCLAGEMGQRKEHHSRLG